MLNIAQGNKLLKDFNDCTAGLSGKNCYRKTKRHINKEVLALKQELKNSKDRARKKKTQKQIEQIYKTACEFVFSEGKKFAKSHQVKVKYRGLIMSFLDVTGSLKSKKYYERKFKNLAPITEQINDCILKQKDYGFPLPKKISFFYPLLFTRDSLGLYFVGTRKMALNPTIKWNKSQQETIYHEFGHLSSYNTRQYMLWVDSKAQHVKASIDDLVGGHRTGRQLFKKHHDFIEKRFGDYYSDDEEEYIAKIYAFLMKRGWDLSTMDPRLKEAYDDLNGPTPTGKIK